MTFRAWATAGAAILVVLTPLTALAAPSCLAAAERAEARARLPAGLLEALVEVESGDDAWVIRAGDRVYRPDSRAEAARLAGRLAAPDVGCFQINLRWHPIGAAALDPHRAAAYAAGLLRREYRATGSWALAAARFHTRDPRRQRWYLCRLPTALGTARRSCGTPPRVGAEKEGKG